MADGVFIIEDDVRPIVVTPTGSPGPRGPKGDTGPAGDINGEIDLPDFTLIFDNGLV